MHNYKPTCEFACEVTTLLVQSDALRQCTKCETMCISVQPCNHFTQVQLYLVPQSLLCDHHSIIAQQGQKWDLVFNFQDTRLSNSLVGRQQLESYTLSHSHVPWTRNLPTSWVGRSSRTQCTHPPSVWWAVSGRQDNKKVVNWWT